MKEIELIAMDLDGTLLHYRCMSEKDREAVLRVLDKGIPIIPATTRMRFSTSQLLKSVPLDRYPLICMNGARVIAPGWDDDHDHEDWYVKRLNMEIARDISTYADKKDYELTTVFRERKYWKKRRDQSVGQHHEDPVATVVEKNRDALDRGEPISFMMHKDKNGIEGLLDMKEFVSDKFGDRTKLEKHHRLGDWVALTVYHSNTSKRKALELVCKKMNIPKKNVMGIGDDEVDVELLEYAGVGVAMGNSPDEVKEIADEVAPYCTDDGVSWIIEKFVL